MHHLPKATDARGPNASLPLSAPVPHIVGTTASAVTPLVALAGALAGTLGRVALAFLLAFLVTCATPLEGGRPATCGQSATATLRAW